MRKCSKCGEPKPATADYFARQSHRRSGLSADCRACRRAEQALRKHDPAAHQRTLRERAIRDGRDPEARGRPKQTPAERRARQRRAANLWRARNADTVRAGMRAANRKRRATLSGALNHRISSNVYQSLKVRGGRKAGRRWEQLVGYSTDDLRAHLERQFRPGMSWANFGEWHVDHIVPLASFTFASPDDDEFRAAWSLANLQPLWALENLQKRDQRLTLL